MTERNDCSTFFKSEQKYFEFISVALVSMDIEKVCDVGNAISAPDCQPCII